MIYVHISAWTMGINEEYTVLRLIKDLFGNLFFIIWLLFELNYLRPFRANIRRFRATMDYERERLEIIKASSLWSELLYRKLAVDLSVESERELPEGPLVFVSNHESYADIPTLYMAIPNRQFGFVAKQNLRDLPLYGRWIEEVRSVFLKRDDVKSSLRTIEEGISYIKDGFSLAVFPEGTRSRGGPAREFKKGSLRLAIKTGVPIIPVSIMGTSQIFEAAGRIKKNVRVRVYVHAPIPTSGITKQESNELTSKVEGIIRGKLAEWQE
jgi:1-acyl-sn-glycerol-3-phosphate acyltransferase